MPYHSSLNLSTSKFLPNTNDNKQLSLLGVCPPPDCHAPLLLPSVPDPTHGTLCAGMVDLLRRDQGHTWHLLVIPNTIMTQIYHFRVEWSKLDNNSLALSCNRSRPLCRARELDTSFFVASCQMMILSVHIRAKYSKLKHFLTSNTITTQVYPFHMGWYKLNFHSLAFNRNRSQTSCRAWELDISFRIASCAMIMLLAPTFAECSKLKQYLIHRCAHSQAFWRAREFEFTVQFSGYTILKKSLNMHSVRGTASFRPGFRLAPHGQMSCHHDKSFDSGNHLQTFYPRQYVSTQEATEVASERMLKARARRQMASGDEFMFPYGILLEFGPDDSDKPITPSNIAKDIADSKRKKGETCDEDHMLKFCANNSLSDICIPSFSSPSEFLLLGGTSVLDVLAVDAKRLDTWNLPDGDAEIFEKMQKSRGLNLSILDQVEVKVLQTTEYNLDIVNDTLNWARAMYRRNQDDAPVGLISMACEEIAIPTETYLRIMATPGIQFQFPVSPPKGTECTQFPVKIMFGDGMTWMLIFEIDSSPFPKRIKKGLEKYAAITNIPFRRPIVEFLEELPKVTGINAEDNVRKLEYLIRGWNGQGDFRMKGFVDLGALAILAGWNLQHWDTTTLSTQLLGGVLNKAVSKGDRQWGRHFKRNTPDSLKAYCIGDVKFGHQAMIVLLRVLLLDLLPDPDVVLSFTRLPARDFIKRFNTFIVESAAGCVIGPDLVFTAGRGRLAASLRFRTATGLSASPPARVVALSEAFAEWPSVVNGGCRYLHQARTHFLTQCRILCDSGFSFWSVDIMPYPITQEMKENATYTMADIHTVSFKDPVVASPDVLGLVMHGDLYAESLEDVDDPTKLTSRLLLRTARMHKRIARELYAEWVRTHLLLLEGFFSVIKADSHYWQHLKSFYNEGRRIYLHCTGRSAPRDADCDRSNQTRGEEAVKEETEIVNRLKGLLAQHTSKLVFLRSSLADDDFNPCNLTWRHSIPTIRDLPHRVKRSRLEYQPRRPAQEFGEFLDDESAALDEPDSPITDAAMSAPPSPQGEVEEDRTVGKRKRKRGRRRLAAKPVEQLTQDEVEEYVELETQASLSPEYRDTESPDCD